MQMERPKNNRRKVSIRSVLGPFQIPFNSRETRTTYGVFVNLGVGNLLGVYEIWRAPNAQKMSLCFFFQIFRKIDEKDKKPLKIKAINKINCPTS